MVAALGPTYFRSRVLEANPLSGDVDACNRALGKCGRDFEHCILFVSECGRDSITKIYLSPGALCSLLKAFSCYITSCLSAQFQNSD